MKTIATTLFALGFIFLSNAQVINDQASIIKLEDVLLAKNSAYLSAVQDSDTPRTVALLQKEAAGYDVCADKAFDRKETTTFEMLFKNNHGKINAFYNSEGKITATNESFRNISLPKVMQQDIYRKHANWEMVGNKYTSRYNDNNLIKRQYKLLLKKGNDTKSIVISMPK